MAVSLSERSAPHGSHQILRMRSLTGLIHWPPSKGPAQFITVASSFHARSLNTREPTHMAIPSECQSRASYEAVSAIARV
jgi:hypothetical protein